MVSLNANMDSDLVILEKEDLDLSQGQGHVPFKSVLTLYRSIMI